MRRKVFYGALLLLLLASCAREVRDAEAEQGLTKLRAGIAAVQTKTWLDSEGGGVPLKVYWSDGDRILVNGQFSAGVEVSPGEKLSEADFSFRSIAAPFRAFYPAEAVTAVGEDGTLSVLLGEVQEYSPGTFANGAAALYGYAENGDNVALKNLCAAIKVNIKDAASSLISSVTLYSPGEPIAGEFSLNPQTGEFVPVNGSKTITLDIGDGIALSPEGTNFWFTVPAGYYQDGFQLSFLRAADHRSMLCNWTPTGNVVSGRLYCFEDVSFVAAAKDIETAEEWEEFALAYNSDGDMSKFRYKDGSVRLGADISAENFTSLKDWTLAFDGQGHSITRTAAEAPLFGTVSGSVTRLTLKGAMTLDGSESYCAPLAPSLVSGGSITGVVNKMDVTLNSGEATVACLAGIVGTMSGGKLADCSNEGALTSNINCSAGKRNVQLAGIVGQVRDLTSDLSISGCFNSGTLTLDPSGQSSSNFIRYGALGGIVAWIRDNSRSIEISGCSNSGQLIWTSGNITGAGGGSSNAPAVCAGGIIGLAAPLAYSTVSSYQNEGQLAAVTADNGFAVSLKDCRSSGEISCKAITGIQYRVGYGKVYIAGLAGALIGKEQEYATIDNCSFTGKIIAWDDTERQINANCKCVVTAGLVGWGGYLSFRNGTNVRATIGSAKRQSVAIAGGIGFAVKPFSFKDCRIWFDGGFSRVSNFKDNRAIVAVVPAKYSSTADMEPKGIVEGSSISDCQVGGNLYISQDIYADTVYGDLTDSEQYGSRYVYIFNGSGKIASNLVCGQGFEANSGVNIDNVTYWDGK